MDVPFRVLDPQYEYGDADGNMIIHGDNLSAEISFAAVGARSSCIYIDPLLLTRATGWVYNDSVNDPRIEMAR